MNRNRLILALALFCVSSLAATAQAQRPPNIILMFTDDQGYQDVGCFGATEIETPNLDRMAEEGRRFTSFYSGAPVCSASRAALLTGCYNMRVGVKGVFFPNRKHQGLNPDEETIAEVLKRRGYATACVGKWHLGDEPQFLPTRQGFDSYYGIPYSNDMRIKRDGKNGTPLMRNETIIEHPVEQSTLTKRYTEEALRFIEKNRAKPFFLYLPQTMPHIPLFASKDFKGKSKGGLYGDTIEEIDWSVGRILATLKRLDLDDNTFVIFTTDNGPWLSKGKHGGSALPLRDGKFTTYEGGMRVPCIMRWPGKVPANTSCSEICSVIDLLPTFTAIASAKRTEGRVIDGRNILPLITGQAGAKSPHDAFHYGLDAVRVGKWKLRLKGRSTVKSKPAGPFPELFDLSSDLSETTNVASAHAQIVASLTKRIEAHRQDIRKNGRPVGQAPVPARSQDLAKKRKTRRKNKTASGKQGKATAQAAAPGKGLRVLILGDSISIGYTAPLRELLQGEAQIFRPMRAQRSGKRPSPENCAGTDSGITNIDRWLAADGGKWDIIHFNFGLHDLKHVHPDTGKNSNDPKHPHQSGPDDYRRQLREIADKLQKTGAKLIFATTTPYPKGVRPLRAPEDAALYNQIARDVMKPRKIAIDDLYTFAAPRLNEIQNKANVHFSPSGSRKLAQQVAKSIRQAMQR